MGLILIDIMRVKAAPKVVSETGKKYESPHRPYI